MTNKTLEQLQKASLLDYIYNPKVVGDTVVAAVEPSEFILSLVKNAHFKKGKLYAFHRDVGEHLVDFRSHRGAFGDGSLQIVIDYHTGNMKANIDKFNPYEDVVSFIGHTGEVIGGLFRRKKNENV